jgi:hypothetical protein
LEARQAGQGTTGSYPAFEHQKPNQYIVPYIVPDIYININVLFNINVNRLQNQRFDVDINEKSQLCLSISGTILDVDSKRQSLPPDIDSFSISLMILKLF